MNIHAVIDENRQKTAEFLESYWGYTLVVLREGEQFDVKHEEGFISLDDDCRINGALMYKISGSVCEILIMCALNSQKGIGTSLIEKAEEAARQNNCHILRVVTTNDNLNAIGFYQKRGFHMARLYINAMDYVRAVKPCIPLIGENSIPLSDELEFEKIIN